jgi:hypothetical protein
MLVFDGSDASIILCGILLLGVGAVKTVAVKNRGNWLFVLVDDIVKNKDSSSRKGFKAMCKTCAAHAKKAEKPAKKAGAKKK